MVYILLAKGFEETEAVAPGDVLRRARIPMQYVGVGGRIIEGAHGISVQADITLEELDCDQMDMIVLPGGPGVAVLEQTPAAMATVEYALTHDRYVGAICAAPTALGKRGWLDGVNAVCYPGMEDLMGKAIVHRDRETVRDGKIITGRAPGAAIEFGLLLASVLPGEYTPDEIAGYMVYECR